MPQLSLDLPHALGQDEAARRLKATVAAARSAYQEHLSDFQEDWQDHTLSFGFRAMGMSVKGTVAIEPENVHVAADLPMAAMFFRGAIESRIRQEVGRLLG